MDKLSHYQNLVKNFLTEYANLMNSQPVPDLETVLSFDDDHGQYMLLKVGWPQGRRIRHTLLHVAIHNNKIWIEEDLTEDGIATYLLEQGVPNQDIVLAFHPPEMRPFTEFAVT
jgi:hypothetical protein